jgi:hypothetical protein
MERINQTDLHGLVPQKPENKAIQTQSKTSLEKDTVILRWVRLAARQNKETLTEEDYSLWLAALSSFPRPAIEWAFGDYLAFELDEFGRAWMPKPPQIAARCEEWCERNAGPPTDSGLKQEMAKWREEEKQNQQDPDYLKAYAALKDKFRSIWPGTGQCKHGGE